MKICLKETLIEALERYPDKLIVTQGALGAVFYDGLEQIEIQGIEREVKDTTGAGDTFNGALAVGLQKTIHLLKLLHLLMSPLVIQLQHLAHKVVCPQ